VRCALCADRDGFNLHSTVRCAADGCTSLEQLCRDIQRPALANEQVQTNAAWQFELTVKTRWRDGATHVVMSSLTCVASEVCRSVSCYRPAMGPADRLDARAQR
jgi:hypothetical protein